jgi:hypothetical protein
MYNLCAINFLKKENKKTNGNDGGNDGGDEFNYDKV